MPLPAQQGRARPTNGSDRGSLRDHDLTLIVGHHGAARDGFISTAYRQHNRAFCADGARSRFECCFRDSDIRPSTEKPSTGRLFVLSSLAYQGRGVQPRAWRHVRILRESAQRPLAQRVRCRNSGRWQRHAPPQGGASKSSRKSCPKTGDGFLPWNCRDQTGFQFGFPSIRFSLPSFLDFGV